MGQVDPALHDQGAAEMATRVISGTCWPLKRWPEVDQAAWAIGITPGDPFDDPHYGPHLREDSRIKVRKGYGRWLSFLAERCWLDPAQSPFARVTRTRLRAYFRALLRAGNADETVIGRFGELTMALKILAPGEDVSWVRRFDGVSVYVLLPKRRRVLMVPESDVLFDWGLEMMDKAPERLGERERLAAYRDGLLIAMLASRGRRLRSMGLLRTGYELIHRDGRFRIELTPDQVKTNKPDRFDLPERLTSYLQHYLDHVRPALLRGRHEVAFWVNTQGDAMRALGIQGRIFKLSRKRFGKAFGPHRFRHAIATTLALRLPECPGLAAGVLDNTPAIVDRYYSRPDQCQAGARYAQLVEGRMRAARKNTVERKNLSDSALKNSRGTPM